MSSKKEQRIYLDYASSTPVHPRVLKKMAQFDAVDFGNPGSIHNEGLVAKKAVHDARLKIARIIEAHSDEIVFTGSGTESNNLAIFGVVNYLAKSRGFDIKKIHLITSKIEHSSVLECFKEFERRGAEVDYLSVNSDGLINLSELENKIKENTKIVSIQYANSEIGVIQQVNKVSKVIQKKWKEIQEVHGKRAKLFFHVDASQAPLFLNISQNYIGADLITFDAQKIYGPKGIALLYVRRGTKIAPIIFGGGQERGLRSGTENVRGIVGFAEAFSIAMQERESESVRLKDLRDYTIGEILKKIQRAEINGSLKHRLQNNINISIPKFDAEFAVLQLDAKGISTATKSACVPSDEASYVISALGKNLDYSRSSLRITIGRQTKKFDLDHLISELVKIV